MIMINRRKCFNKINLNVNLCVITIRHICGISWDRIVTYLVKI